MLVETQHKRNKWVSVKDRLPDEKQSEITHDFEYVLCATTFGDVRAYKFGTPIGWKEPHFWNGSGLMDEYVTHWMYLLEMPNTSEILKEEYNNDDWETKCTIECGR